MEILDFLIEYRKPKVVPEPCRKAGIPTLRLEKTRNFFKCWCTGTSARVPVPHVKQEILALGVENPLAGVPKLDPRYRNWISGTRTSACVPVITIIFEFWNFMEFWFLEWYWFLPEFKEGVVLTFLRIHSLEWLLPGLSRPGRGLKAENDHIFFQSLSSRYVPRPATYIRSLYTKRTETSPYMHGVAQNIYINHYQFFTHKVLNKGIN